MSTAAKLQSISDAIDFGEALIPKLADSDKAQAQADVEQARADLAKLLAKYFTSLSMQQATLLGSPEAPGLQVS